jgi:hypothetical protein
MVINWYTDEQYASPRHKNGLSASINRKGVVCFTRELTKLAGDWGHCLLGYDPQSETIVLKRCQSGQLGAHATRAKGQSLAVVANPFLASIGWDCSETKQLPATYDRAGDMVTLELGDLAPEAVTQEPAPVVKEKQKAGRKPNPPLKVLPNPNKPNATVEFAVAKRFPNGSICPKCTEFRYADELRESGLCIDCSREVARAGKQAECTRAKEDE